ncbi:hypothetical protein [Alkalihalophilus marmarensis]|uniref:Uncharacterized protein n=1 Tax=Alkalihalophilus marmarensis DSM 21297 TaxID=1188261 RepID=U6SLI6_9BACI|nr:hypothetical protein [Alkalihalophilus marmarensis]ERN52257.1 hypothetical protein A33I_17270 [Alkalihalophilus marmarensis DSM 21297]
MKIFKLSIIYVSILAMLFTSMGSVSADTSSSFEDYTSQEIKEASKILLDDDYLSLFQQTFLEAVYEKNGKFHFDIKIAQELSMTKEQAKNLNDLVTKSFSYSEVQDMYTYLENTETLTLGLIGTEEEAFTIMNVFTDRLAKIFYAAIVVYVGTQIANQVIADLYRLGAIGMCRKWESNKHVKTACEALGYL